VSGEVLENPIRAYNAAVEQPQVVVLKSFGSRVDAELAKGALDNAGIEAIIQSDSVGRMRDHIAWSGPGFQILVREEDVAAANEALIPIDDPDFKDDDPESSWRKFT
jgi:hypothetical protein